MILITGPTGCGKTLSLYSGLNILNQEDINIATAEDPVEIHLSGINQVQSNPKLDLVSLRRYALFSARTLMWLWSVRYVILKQPTSLLKLHRQDI